jgi:hypothetical protein
VIANVSNEHAASNFTLKMVMNQKTTLTKQPANWLKDWLDNYVTNYQQI